MKYRIYIDEVGHADMKGSAIADQRYLCLTGVIFELDFVRVVLQPQLDALKSKYFKSDPDDPLILHRKELVQRKGPFSVLLDPVIGKAFDEEFLGLLKDWDYTVIGVIIDKQELNEQYSASWKYDPYHYCQEVLIERFKLFLNLHGAVGDVMIESRGGKEDMRLKNSFERLMENGTRFIQSEELRQFFTSKQLKVKAKATNVSGLQIADLLAHSVRRYGFKEFWNLDDGKQTFSDEIINVLLEGKFLTYKGNLIGKGLKKLP